MEKYKLTILISVFYICFSCSPDNDQLSNHVNIYVEPEQLGQTIKSEGIIDTLWRVKLETTEDNLVGTVFRILCNGKYIYLYDLGQDAVFIFEMDGKYVNKIDDKGKGPGEYIKIDEVQLASGNDELIIYGNRKFLYYTPTGEFLRSEQPDQDIYFFNRKELGNSDVAFFTGKKNNFLEGVRNRHLTIKTNDGSFKSYFPNELEKEIKIISTDPYIFSNSYDTYFQIPFRNQIYKISEKDVELIYNIKITEGEIPSEVFKEVRDTDEFKMKYFSNPNYISIFGSVVATNNYIIVPLCSKNWRIIGNLWISLKTNNYFVAKNIELPSKEPLSTYARTTIGDTVITLQDGIEANRMGRKINEISTNPYITFYTLKDL
jgi:hypothetical protein